MDHYPLSHVAHTIVWSVRAYGGGQRACGAVVSPRAHWDRLERHPSVYGCTFSRVLDLWSRKNVERVVMETIKQAWASASDSVRIAIVAGVVVIAGLLTWLALSGVNVAWIVEAVIGA